METSGSEISGVLTFICVHISVRSVRIMELNWSPVLNSAINNVLLWRPLLHCKVACVCVSLLSFHWGICTVGKECVRFALMVFLVNRTPVDVLRLAIAKYFYFAVVFFCLLDCIEMIFSLLHWISSQTVPLSSWARAGLGLSTERERHDMSGMRRHVFFFL